MRANMAWMVIGDPPKVRCYSSRRASQFVTDDAFLESGKLTDVHDEVLDGLTKEVNKLFLEAEQKAPVGRQLGILATPDGLFLAWSEEHEGEEASEGMWTDAVHADSDPDDVRAALGYTTR